MEHGKKKKIDKLRIMKKYYQLILVIACAVSVVTLLIYRHEYYRLRYVLEVLNFFGKPGGSNDLTLCTNGINSTILSEKLDSINARTLDILPYFQRIDDNHFAYSSFWRENSPHSDLTVQTQYFGVSNTIVLGSKHVKQNFRCHFLFEEEERPVIGKFSYSRLETKASVKENKDYVVFVFHCKLTRALGTPHGVSFYPNSDLSPIYSPVIRMIDLDKNYTSRSEKSNLNKISFEDTSKITACVMPNKMPMLSRKNVVEFLAFHKLMGITEFHVYDNTLPVNLLEKIQILPIELTGFSIYVIPFNFPFSTEDYYHLMRDLAELDCIFRNLNRNKKMGQRDFNLNEKTSHIVNLAWDEFIVPRFHYSLKVLLKSYETGRKIDKVQLPTLHFCLNQRNDPKVKPDYPDVVKKTHFDKSTSSDRPAFVLNIASMTIHDIEISTTLELHPASDKSTSHKTEMMSQDVVAIHKYFDCRENGFNRPYKNLDMDFADFDTRPHQFEGAMFRFAENLYNSKLYTLYRTGKIWHTKKHLD